MTNELDGLEGYVEMALAALNQQHLRIWDVNPPTNRVLAEEVVLALAEQLRGADDCPICNGTPDEPLRRAQERIKALEAEMERRFRSSEANRKIYAKKLKHIDELEAALREIYEITWSMPGTNRPMRITQIVNQFLDTEAKP